MDDPELWLHASHPVAGSATVEQVLRRYARRAGWQVVSTRRGSTRLASTLRNRLHPVGPDPDDCIVLTRLLDRCARRGDRVIVSGEELALLVARSDPATLTAIGRVARRRAVTLVLYLRPQHEALEATWCREGFTTGVPPSQWVRERLTDFDYSALLDTLDHLAPELHVRFRPAVPALLTGGQIGTDVTGVLALDLDLDRDRATADDAVVSRELPLELANLLRSNDHGRPTSEYDVAELHRLTGHWSIPPSPNIARSRDVLRAAVADRFGSGTLRLLDRTGWPRDHFLPQPDASTAHLGLDDLDELDDLWRPEADGAEQQIILGAVDDMARAASRRRLGS